MEVTLESLPASGYPQTAQQRDQFFREHLYGDGLRTDETLGLEVEYSTGSDASKEGPTTSGLSATSPVMQLVGPQNLGPALVSELVSAVPTATMEGGKGHWEIATEPYTVLPGNFRAIEDRIRAYVRHANSFLRRRGAVITFDPCCPNLSEVSPAPRYGRLQGALQLLYGHLPNYEEKAEAWTAVSATQTNLGLGPDQWGNSHNASLAVMAPLMLLKMCGWFWKGQPTFHPGTRILKFREAVSEKDELLDLCVTGGFVSKGRKGFEEAVSAWTEKMPMLVNDRDGVDEAEFGWLFLHLCNGWHQRRPKGNTAGIWLEGFREDDSFGPFMSVSVAFLNVMATCGFIDEYGNTGSLSDYGVIEEVESDLPLAYREIKADYENVMLQGWAVETLWWRGARRATVDVVAEVLELAKRAAQDKGFNGDTSSEGSRYLKPFERSLRRKRSGYCVLRDWYLQAAKKWTGISPAEQYSVVQRVWAYYGLQDIAHADLPDLDTAYACCISAGH